MLSKDNIKLGMALGLLAPVVGFFGYYLLRFRLFTLKEFYQVLMMQKSLISGIASLSLVMDVIIFTIYINKRKDKTAIGIFIATVAYSLVGLLIKWFG